MCDNRLTRLLQIVHGRGTEATFGKDHRRLLRADLLTSYRTYYPRHRRWPMFLSPWNRCGRLAMAGVAMLALGIAACTTSTTTEVQLGQKISIGLADKTADLGVIDAQVQDYLAGVPGIENLNLDIRREAGGEARLVLMAWGQGLDGDQLMADLRQAVPALAEAEMQVESLSGAMQESFASHLKREIFRMEVDGGTAEEIKAQILAQLSAQGAHDAEVDVQMEDGKTRITVKVAEDSESE